MQRPHPPIVIGGRGPKRTLRAAALWAQQWNCIVEDPETWRGLKEILLGHCADVGRNPADIACSVNVRWEREEDLSAAVEEAAAYGEAGVDLVIINLPGDATPATLEPLATALTALR